MCGSETTASSLCEFNLRQMSRTIDKTNKEDIPCITCLTCSLAVWYIKRLRLTLSVFKDHF